MFCWPPSLYNVFQMKPTVCTLLLSIFISTSLHVSGNYVPIDRRIYCIYATLVFVTVYGWLSGLQTRQPPDCSLNPTSRPDSHQTAVSTQPADQTATRPQSQPNQQTRQPPDCSPIPTKRSDCHQTAVPSQLTDQTATHTQWQIPVSRRYSKFTWSWVHSCTIHVEKFK